MFRILLLTLKIIVQAIDKLTDSFEIRRKSQTTRN